MATGRAIAPQSISDNDVAGYHNRSSSVAGNNGDRCAFEMVDADPLMRLLPIRSACIRGLPVVLEIHRPCGVAVRMAGTFGAINKGDLPCHTGGAPEAASRMRKRAQPGGPCRKSRRVRPMK